MSRQKPNAVNVFDLEPYKSILNLIEFYGGLEPIYIRYALVENHDEDNIYKKSFRSIKEFFDKRHLDELYRSKKIKVCISPKTSKSSLSNFLETLTNLGIVYKYKVPRRKNEKKGRRQIIKYKIKEEYKYEILKRWIGDTIYSYGGNEVMELKEVKEWEIGNILLGIKKETQEAFTDTEMRQIRYNVKEIEKLLIEIDRIHFIRFYTECAMKGEDVRNGYINQRDVEKVERYAWEYVEEGRATDYSPLTFVRFSSFTTFMNKVEREQEKEMKRMMDIQIKAEKKKKRDRTP